STRMSRIGVPEPDLVVDPAHPAAGAAAGFAGMQGAVARRQAWGLAGGVLLLYALLRFTAGPLAQWLDYHDFADTRALGPIPHAGDVLTNLAILAAGLWSASVYRQVTLVDDE